MKRKVNPIRLFTLNKPCRFGGLGSYPKSKIYAMLKHLPQVHLPRWKLITNQTTCKEMLTFAHYPCILKPDEGRRGRGAIVIKNKAELVANSKLKENYILSDFYSYPYEGGLFFLRNTKKLYVNLRLYKTGKTFTQKVPAYAISKLMQESYEYEDITLRLSKKAREYIIAVCLQISELEYGRFDIRIQNLDTFLAQGKSWRLLELNLGIDVIPHHAYDQRYNWKEKYTQVLEEAFTK